MAGGGDPPGIVTATLALPVLQSFEIDSATVCYAGSELGHGRGYIVGTRLVAMKIRPGEVLAEDNKPQEGSVPGCYSVDAMSAQAEGGLSLQLEIFVENGSYVDVYAVGLKLGPAQPLAIGGSNGPPVDGTLRQNVPSPFTGTTRIGFAIERAGKVELEIFDVTGRRVRTLLEGSLAAGEQHALWDARDDRGSRVPAGTYFYRLSIDNAPVESRKAVVVE
jgi:hypothetical protein